MAWWPIRLGFFPSEFWEEADATLRATLGELYEEAL